MTPPPGERWAASGVHLRRISGRTTFLLLALIGFLLHLLQWVLLPFIIAGLMAYLCTAVVDWLRAKTQIPRAALAGATLLGVLILLSLAGWLAIPPLARGLARLPAHLQALTETLTKAALGDSTVNLFGKSMNAESLTKAAMAGLENFADRTTVLAPAGGGVFAVLFAFPLTLVLFIYFLFGGPTIARGLLWLVPPNDRPMAARVWGRLDPVLRRYFVGVIGIIAYTAVAAYVGLGVFLHAPHAALLALATGALELMPVIGPAASAVFAGLVTIEHAKGVGPIIGYALYATALRLSIDQWLGPIALGAASRLHPTVIMLCFLVGATLFGVAGVILAVPAALATKTALTVLYEEPAVDAAA